MKIENLIILFFAVITLGFFENSARAEPVDKTVIMEVKQEIEIQNNENLIDKIETAQKEQFLKFMQKKQNVQDSEYI